MLNTIKTILNATHPSSGINSNNIEAAKAAVLKDILTLESFRVEEGVRKKVRAFLLEIAFVITKEEEAGSIGLYDMI